jgi:hypothetical protein
VTSNHWQPRPLRLTLQLVQKIGQANPLSAVRSAAAGVSFSCARALLLVGSADRAPAQE